MKPLFVPAIACLLASPGWAQSVITLDDFDLGGTSEPAAPKIDKRSGMADCLKNPASCADSGFKSDVTFSIDDVVNLGIIDREDVAPQPASTGAAASVKPSDPLPSIDLEVLFDRNSDAIRPDQMPQLVELSTVLRQDDFRNYRLVFMGHTDAKGSVEYNSDLSRRRAESVAQFVALTAGVPPDRIRSVGFGFSQLAVPSDPYAERNRRVQLVLVPTK
ncbi:OmpA family protein [Mesobacterium sp. TK19101]|uniref:OmpA family protein n=1 Tax=Mesobacterium hydrothermale TaxID=3111907 RepID=A0ABU6HM25_9RHOB|nr:OmpA family protein [Mesobacterium sp. TK19101]MEC3862508.1 OmpA family protein [Mesobacterium sp. TK19101]